MSGLDEKPSLSQKVRVLFLGEDGKSKDEKRLVRKLGQFVIGETHNLLAYFFILTYCCLSSFFNYLDRSAFANAYVAGLREDLGLVGNQYNVILAMFTAGSVIGQIPHGIIIQKIAPRIWLPSMVLVWAALTMTCAGCKTYTQLCAVRFLQGLAEASTYCGTIYIIGSWYRPQEIAKRTAIFTASGQAGTMFAGIMMTAIHQGMDTYASLAGWQWVFIINGIITCPIALMGFISFPDVPELTSARWLSKPERQLALSRLAPKNPNGHNISPWSLTTRVLASPTIYILCLFAIITGALEAYPVQGIFLLYLKYHSPTTFTQTAVNTYPLGIQAVGIISNFLAAVHIDATGRRVPMGLLAAILQLIVASLLLVPPETLGFAGAFVAHYLSGTSYMVNPVLYGWASVICQRGGDDAARAVVLYSMNAASTCLYTFWGIVLYPADDAPYWFKGGVAMVVVVVCMVGLVWGVWWLDGFTDRKYGSGVVRSGSGEMGRRDGDAVLVCEERGEGEFGRKGVVDGGDGGGSSDAVGGGRRKKSP